MQRSAVPARIGEKMQQRARWSKIIIATALCPWTLAATAQNFPAKPIRIVVPFAPGGANDVIARVVSQQLAQPLGQQAIVENRGGAGGAVGADVVARSTPDGYTLLLANPGPNAINPSLQPKTPYDPIRDFSMITLMA